MRPVAHPHPLGWKAECLETLRLAGPLSLANFLQSLTYAVDVIFIARLGADDLAAAALGVSLFGMLVWSLFGLTGATSPIIAAELGARGPALRPVRRAVRMGLWLAVMAGAAAMLVVSQSERLMLLAGQKPQLAALAGTYLNILLFSIIPSLLANVLRNFVSTLGRPVFATIITGLGIGFNALGNYAFIFGHFGVPAMGLAGGAMATVLSTAAMCAIYVLAIRLDPRLHRYRVFGKVWRPDWPRLAEIVRIGTPIAFTTLAEAGIFGAAAFLMGLLGTDQLAAHALALQIAAMAFQVPMGVSQAATIRVGYFFGAHESNGVRHAGWSAIGMGAGFMMMSALAMLLAPRYLLAIYIDPWSPANAAVTALACRYLLVAAAFQLSDGLQVVAAGTLRGLKDTRVPMWIALFSYWVPGFGLAVGLGFGAGLGGTGIWLGLAAGLTCSAILQLTRWSMRERLGLLAPGIA